MKKLIICMMFNCLIIQNSLQAQSNSISYQDTGAFSKDAPGFNAPDDDPKFHNITPIMFTPHEDVITGDDSNQNQFGLFWDTPDTDQALQFPGKARIGNSCYINVVAADSKNINQAADADSVISTGAYNIYASNPIEKKQFNPKNLVLIGTFMKQNDPTIYNLYGQYETTVFPDPNTVEIT